MRGSGIFPWIRALREIVKQDDKMQRSTVLEKLTRYFAQDVLSGEDAGLDETTPLLEWGIINSIEMAKLLHFIHQQFAIDIPPDKLEADSFTTISSIADLVLNTVQLSTNEE